MRLGNRNNRAVLVTQEGAGLDVATASGGKFGPDLQSIYDSWEEFRQWAAEQDLSAAQLIDRARLGSPSPTAPQIFAVGLNYRKHAAEAGLDAPEEVPLVFTKYASCITGPNTTVALPPKGLTDWEVELVVVIGRRAERVSEADAWSYVAGVAVGQDLTERNTQLAGVFPQFSRGKSYPGFGPVGPWLVTTDELDNPDDLTLGCSIDGEVVQEGRTRDMIFPVSKLVAILSGTLTLLPGDMIFTGTPDGVGWGRDPQKFLAEGQTLNSWIVGVGEIEQTFTVARVA